MNFEPAPAMRIALVNQVHQLNLPAADLVVLPELPLNDWCPATKNVRAEDAEPLDGPRQRALAACGVSVLGGAIIETDGVRHNTAVVYRDGRCVHRYRKVHLPNEEGFWEAHHYSPGTDPPQRFDDFGFPLGIQICSDTNRPFGSQLLAAQGVGAILIPRATERRTWPRWKLVFQALALTCSCYVLSVNRPGQGPSVVVDPQGTVLEEGEDTITVDLDFAQVEAARRGYPGYLALYPELYARGWSSVNFQAPPVI